MGGGGEIRYVVLTDIARSSHLWETFPAEYPELLESHNRVVEKVVDAHGGEVMKNLGDGFFTLFDNALSALDAAVDMQLALVGLPAFPDGTALQIRAVVHGGPLQQLPGQAGDWFGPPLNRTARIAGVCHAGQTLISGFIRHACPELPAEVELLDLGQVRLRDLGDPEQIFQVGHPGFARQSFPALLGMESRPNNLREQPGSFIGREEELKQLRHLLLDDKQRLITLIAPGGYGKSRVANQLCASLLHHYEHGAWVVELAPLPDAARIAERTADALNFQFYTAAPPQEQLVDYLRGKQLLIHFDNFEYVAAGSDLLAAILQDCPGVQCIVTSRMALRLRGEKVVPLEPLAAAPAQLASGSAASKAPGGRTAQPRQLVPPAVELFADRALLVDAHFRLDAAQLPAVIQLCQRLDGVPLAVELAAAWADMMSPDELLEELTQQLELTARMSDVPERQRSVRASCDWSWKLLTPEQQTALMQCSVFRGGFFIEAAEAVLGVKGMALRALLGGLLDKSWLYTREVYGQTRYSIRDAAAREYAWERLEETRHPSAVGGQQSAEPVSGEAARANRGLQTADNSLYEFSVAAHAAYFSALAQREGPRLHGAGVPDRGAGQRAALHAWKLELENITEAIDSALNRGRRDLLLPVTQWLWLFLDSTGGALSSSERYAVLLAGARRLTSPELELQAQLGLVWAQFRMGRYTETRAAAGAALELAEDLGNREAEERARRLLGLINILQGDYAAAGALLTQALDISRALGKRDGEAACLNGLGLVHNNQGNYAAARELYRQSLEAYRELGNRQGEAICLSNLGFVHASQGDYPAARELRSQALAISREIGERRVESYALHGIGQAYLLEGNYRAAGEWLQLALRVRREIGYKAGMAVSSVGAAATLAGLGRWRDAAICLSGALSAIVAIGYKLDLHDQLFIDSTHELLGAASGTGVISDSDLAQWQAAGAIMPLDELAGFALAELSR